MAAPCVGACASWIEFADLCSPCAEIPYPDEAVDVAMSMATDLLYFATAQQFPGTCRTVLRPCSSDFCGSYVPYDLRYTNGGYSNWTGCGCADAPRCSCTPFRQVEFGYTPLTSIVEVKVCNDSNPDWPGTCVLNPAYYHIDAFRYLVRDPNPDGTNPGWPHCSQMSPDTSLEDTFEVDFTYGHPAPDILKRAAAILACEIVIGCDPDAFADTDCRLPRNVVSIARQGVNVVLQSAFFTTAPGRPIQFGIPEVDWAIATFNPTGNTAPAVILSADDHDYARRVDT